MGLYVDEYGPAQATTIVFLHGGGVSGWMWKDQVEQLSEYHCLVPDLPEHGQSLSEKPFSIQDSARKVAELITTCTENGRAHVVGLSLGAQIIIHLLATYPEVVDHAIISGALVEPIRGAGSIRILSRIYMPFKHIEFLVRANMNSAGIPEQYYQYFRNDTLLLTVDSFARVMTENMSFNIPAGLEAARVPTLVAVGQKERKVMIQSARKLIAVLPDAKAVVAANLGHSWNLQNPALFTAMIRAWITDKALPPGFLPLT